MKKNTPISSFSRSKVVVKSVAKIGVKKTVSFTKKAFLSKDEKLKEDEKINDEIAELIFKNLSLLKGTAIKISQALVLHNMLPKKLEKKLSKSFNDVHPISQALVMKVLENEFDKKYNKIFDNFTLKPFASASLGQVHLAHIDDKKLAVKIQYPSIDKTIENDLKLLSKIIKIKKEFIPILSEIQKRLYEEIDYKKEAQNTIWAYNNFVNNNVLVPKVYEKYSSKHILTTSYIDAVDLYSWLQTKPSKKIKTDIANLMFKVFTKSLFELKKMQADPNPANYLIKDDKRLVLIDFGCIKIFDDAFINNYIKIFKVYNSTNKKTILEAYREFGFIDDISLIDDVLYKNIVDFNTWGMEPFRNDEYIFTKEYLSKGLKYAKMFGNEPFRVVEDFVFLDRTLHGLFSLFANMNVTIDMRYFNKFIE